MDKDTLINRRLTGENSFQKNEEHEHGKHPNSLANLKPFEKGISGNPGGRPVKYAKLKKALDKWAVINLMLFCYSLTNNNTITPILYIGRLKEK